LFSEESSISKDNNLLRVSEKSSLLSFGKFDKINGKYILTGGGSPNEVKILDISNRHYATFYGFSYEVFTGDFSSDNKMIALAGDQDFVRIYSVDLD